MPDLKMVLQQLPVGVVAVDEMGEVVFINDAARRHNAGPNPSRAVREQAVDGAVRELGTGRPLAVEESALGRALRGEEVRDFQYILRWPGASHDIWMNVSASPLRGSNGAVKGAVLVIAETGGPGVRTADAAVSVSFRESQILGLIAAGRTNRQIGQQLNISENTVKKYVSNLLYRHGLSRRSQVASFLRCQLHPTLPERLEVLCRNLTETERRILWLIALGNTNRKIARALTTTERTVKAHVSAILQKLRVKSRSEAAALAVGLGVSSGESGASLP